jgi:hypothetical protein
MQVEKINNQTTFQGGKFLPTKKFDKFIFDYVETNAADDFADRYIEVISEARKRIENEMPEKEVIKLSKPLIKRDRHSKAKRNMMISWSPTKATRKKYNLRKIYKDYVEITSSKWSPFADNFLRKIPQFVENTIKTIEKKKAQCAIKNQEDTIKEASANKVKSFLDQKKNA